MGHTLQLKSLLRRIPKSELVKLSKPLGWSEADLKLTKDKLVYRAEREIRDLASTRLGNVLRRGEPVPYREVLTDIVKKYGIEVRSRETIIGMEANIARDVVEKLCRGLKGIPKRKQLQFLADLKKKGYRSIDEFLQELAAGKGDPDHWYTAVGAGVGVTLGMGVPVLGIAMTLGLLAAKFGRKTNLDRASWAVTQVFYFRQEYDPGWRKLRSNIRKSMDSGAIRVALVGRVSSGKSATINAIFGRMATKVSPIPGSTDEVAEFKLTDNLVLIDTPGLEDSKNPKWSKEAMAFAKQSDVVLFIVNAQQVTAKQKTTYKGLTDWGVPCLVVLNKMDTIRGDRDRFADEVRRKLGCQKKNFMAGALNPRSRSDWDSASDVLTKVTGIIRSRERRIFFNREVTELFRTGLDELGDISQPTERKKLSEIIKRIGIA